MRTKSSVNFAHSSTLHDIKKILDIKGSFLLHLNSQKEALDCTQNNLIVDTKAAGEDGS
jgi:hypothetical protein